MYESRNNVYEIAAASASSINNDNNINIKKILIEFTNNKSVIKKFLKYYWWQLWLFMNGNHISQLQSTKIDNTTTKSRYNKLYDKNYFVLNFKLCLKYTARDPRLKFNYFCIFDLKNFILNLFYISENSNKRTNITSATI